MTILRMCVAASVLIGSSTVAQAGLFGGGGHGGAKCDTCGPESCVPECKPTIARPCNRSVHTYQRKCSTLKPPTCCDTGCCDTGCCDTKKRRVRKVLRACRPVKSDCCEDPCVDDCCDTGCGKGCGGLLGKLFDHGSCNDACVDDCCDSGCGKSCGGLLGKLFNHGGCDDGCVDDCDADDDCCVAAECCDYDPCELAELIYQSMTACYAKDRRRAISKLGRKFDCVCNPEIMVAFLYALNDADERVRAEAADEIGDQIRKNACCCSQQVVTGLTCALADCDRGVRRQASQALKLCGYEIVDGCCETECCEVACCDAGCAPAVHSAPAATAPAAPAEAAPTPAVEAPAPPAEEVRTYFPKRLPANADAAPVRNNTLASILGF